MKKIIRDERAISSLIYSISALIFLCVVTLIIIITMQFRELTYDLERTASETLDEYITQETEKNIESIKNGNDYIFELTKSEYISFLASALGTDERLQGINGTGREFKIEVTKFNFINAQKMQVEIELAIYMPVVAGGIEFSPINTKLIIKSELISKF